MPRTGAPLICLALAAALLACTAGPQAALGPATPSSGLKPTATDAVAPALVLSASAIPRPETATVRQWPSGSAVGPLSPTATWAALSPTAVATVPPATAAAPPPSTATPTAPPPTVAPPPTLVTDRLPTVLAKVPFSSEISDVMGDPEHGRLYVADEAGNIHALDDRSYTRLADLPAGKALLALDAPNHLLFVASVREGDVTVVDTADLSVTAVITGGDRVAVDSAGQRAFVGWADQPEGLPEEVQVWDTRTFQRLGAIQHQGAPTYNPLRDEVYLPGGYPRLAVTIVDGQSLEVTGDLEFDVPPGKTVDCFPWDPYVAWLGFDPQFEVIVVDFGVGGRGEEPERQVLSARTLEPLTHAVTVLYQPGMRHLGYVVLPPEEGRVYAVQRMFLTAYYPRTINTTVWRAGTNEMIERREYLCLDLVIPGTRVGLIGRSTGFGGHWEVVDVVTWAPLGSFDELYFHRLDTQTRRLYARWGSMLTVLGY